MSAALLLPDPSQWSPVRAFDHWTQATPDRPFLLDCRSDDVQTVTYGEAMQEARAVAAAARRQGVGPSDAVLVLAHNSSRVVTAVLGVLGVGAVAVLASQLLTDSELRAVLDLAAPKLILADNACGERVRSLAEGRTCLSLAEAATQPATEPLTAPVAHATALVLFTSGTTGMPKGVEMSHSHVYFFAEQFRHLEGLSPRDRFLVDKPLSGAAGLVHSVLAPMAAGGSAAIYREFSASRWLHRINDTGCTAALLLGSMMHAVHASLPLEGASSSLQVLHCGPTDWSLAADFEGALGAKVVEAYGGTETSLPIIAPVGEQRPHGSTGRLEDRFFEVRLVDPDTDRAVEPGEIGEMLVRPRLPWTTFSSYYGNPGATARAWRNLWYHTGDLFRVDEHGWYSFVDRVGDVLRHNGYNVSSDYVESAVRQHDGVADAAVVAVPRRDGFGTELVAYLERAHEVDIDCGRIHRALREDLAVNAVPRYLVVVDDLPRSSTGKVRKATLRSAGVPTGAFDGNGARA